MPVLDDKRQSTPAVTLAPWVLAGKAGVYRYSSGMKLILAQAELVGRYNRQRL